MTSRISARLARLELRHTAPVECERHQWYARRSEGELVALAAWFDAKLAATAAKTAPPPAPPRVAKLLRELRRTRRSPSCEDCRRVGGMTEADLISYTTILRRAIAEDDAKKAGASAGPSADPATT